ncbi:hypothetical protein [Halomonas elongata]|uniref:Single-stranded DNA-binding protein n=1 Tax=Halomonas elongata (strain ATCC 33173 / DSM 2581 / NBRC 15536 / NCIMB 2198 / 1H9) TaxID=768066 RepID=A0ABZ0T5Y5_HALED|nr:hypothetical protein [Halomonas elongata]WBF17822.1 hypothetical protein LM502_17420 [Halomonas elongata]WPU46667.1 hypothetical protein SR933_15670 [Halomonas elongata DSM 2581]
MAKQYVVARGEIQNGNKVIAREGEEYKPSNAAERDRLVSRGVLVEVEGSRKGSGRAASSGSGSEAPPAGSGQQGDGGQGGEGSGDQNLGS